MKLTNTAPAGLTAAALLLAGAMAAQAATPLTARVALRGLTTSEIADYKLTGAQIGSGLKTIGVGSPAYLEAQLNSAIPASDIVSVTWDITSKPVGSAAYLTNSPIGANVPLFSPSYEELFQVGGRTLLRPDVTGQYTVTATITTASNGSTNVSQTITAATYMGLNTCKLCHSGGLIAENIVASYTNTAHATALARKLDDSTGHFGANCVSCHSVGYDANPLAVNGGFDDVAKQLGWKVPTVLTNGNWAAMPDALKNVSNIQCENCHGPGSEHAYSLGDVTRISKTLNETACSQCHDAKTHHIKSPEWKLSKHAIATREPSGSAGCVGCHTASGYAARMSGAPATTGYEAITCAACHDPHDAKNVNQLRVVGPQTLMDGVTTITNIDKAGLCISCHLSRRNGYWYASTNSASSTFGPHEGPQADMLVGANAYTYGKVIPSSAHRDVIEDACVTCHMQATTTTDAAFLKAGGHTFSMSYENGTNKVAMTGVCKECHGPITSFDLVRQDYDGDGVVEGVQTEVKHLMAKLALMLPPVGVAKVDLAIDKNWTRQQLKAGYNYKFVQKDGSYGVHNVSYAVGLLKASIADLTGDGNNDGLPDAWQIQYFGSTSNPAAAPNAIAAGDGVPNWLKYSLGLDPTKPGMTVPGGVVWANGTTLKGGATNTVQIFTAAEVAFNTEAGKTYQLQAISSLGGGWQNVGTPITGTGAAMSYVTPTRPNLQQFFRVVTQ
ncbi:MAG TPA: hypothetical protein VNT26_13950 [Candidatus Sulfotelmatobacter sp.]|nr:hypothetical protein [Candidatus Sulfotelmatobacter sp.]